MKLTYDQVINTVPKNQKKNITPEMVEKINQINEDPLLAESYGQNFIGYITAMQSGKYSMQEYLNAVMFVSYKLIGASDINSYAKVFPGRFKRLLDNGLDRSSISPYVTAYKKNKLVNEIFEQTMVPTHIINAPLYQEALSHQRYLMLNANSETVQQRAADSLLLQLKPPESQKLEIDIGVRKDDVIEDYELAMAMMVKKQKELISKGADVKTVTNASVKPSREIIDVSINAEIEETKIEVVAES